MPYLAGWAEAAAPDTFERIAELVDRRLETALGAHDNAGAASDTPAQDAATPVAEQAAA